MFEVKVLVNLILWYGALLVWWRLNWRCNTTTVNTPSMTWYTRLETTGDSSKETDQLAEEGKERKEECRVELAHGLGGQLDQRYGQRYSLQGETCVRPFYKIFLNVSLQCTALEKKLQYWVIICEPIRNIDPIVVTCLMTKTTSKTQTSIAADRMVNIQVCFVPRRSARKEGVRSVWVRQ